MKPLDVLTLACLLAAGAAGISKWFAHEHQALMQGVLASFIALTAERHARSWWQELDYRGAASTASVSAAIEAIKSRSTLLTLFVPMSADFSITPGKDDQPREVRIRSWTSDLVVGVCLLATSVLVLLALGYSGTASGRIFSQVLLTSWGLVVVYVLCCWLCCWSLAYVLFSRHIFAGRLQ
jgi:hypothetical protein